MILRKRELKIVELNKFYIGESANFIKNNIPDNFVDLTITSPPYDDLRKYNGYTFDYKSMFNELYRVTKDGGIVVWVVSDKTEEGSETGTSFKQALYAKEIGFNIHDTMIYEKASRIPTQDRYYNVFEYMFILSKGKPKTLNFICDHKNKTQGAKKKKDLCINKGNNQKKDEYLITGEYSRRSNIWTYGTGRPTDLRKIINDKKITYQIPAIFPEQLTLDHILSWSNEGDVIFDPMCGSGTVPKMAYLNKRNFIGIDMSDEYINDICIPRLTEYGWGNK